MNLINLKDLQIRLSENLVSEREAFQYLLANWLLFGMIAFGAVDKNHDNPGVMLMLLLIPSFGLLIAYFANKTGDGQDFLKRFIAIHWILGLRFLAILIAGMFFTVYLISSFNNQILKNWIIGLFCISVGIGFYISLARAIRGISKFHN